MSTKEAKSTNLVVVDSREGLTRPQVGVGLEMGSRGGRNEMWQGSLYFWLCKWVVVSSLKVNSLGLGMEKVINVIWGMVGVFQEVNSKC